MIALLRVLFSLPGAVADAAVADDFTGFEAKVA